MPGGVNSPVRSFKHIGETPVYFAKGEGAFLESVDGRRFIDFCMGFGPHILGHSPQVVVNAVSAQLAHGTSLGACNPLEVELCEELLLSYPFLERVRLVNTGTEAVMTALRLARAVTGRAKTLKFEGCYHGHFDSLLVSAGSGVADLPQASSKGVPKEIAETTVVARLDDPASWGAIFERHGSSLAAVIVEPVPANEGLFLPSRTDLRRLVDIARAAGAVVIFDEVISGFRLGLSGAVGHYDIRPDIVTLGKVIGGGLPLAAVMGTGRIMDELAPIGSAYQAGTFSGNVLSVTAGLACVRELRRSKPYADLERRTTLFADELGDVLRPLGVVTVTSLGSIFWFRFGEGNQFPPALSEKDRVLFRKFYSRVLEKGIYFPPSPYEVCFVSTAHSDAHMVEALEKISAAVRELA